MVQYTAETEIAPLHSCATSLKHPPSTTLSAAPSVGKLLKTSIEVVEEPLGSKSSRCLNPSSDVQIPQDCRNSAAPYSTAQLLAD